MEFKKGDDGMQNGQYPNENRKKRNKASVVFAVCVITGVALAAAAILVTMALVNLPDSQPDPDAPVTSGLTSSEETSSAASETGSMTVSTVESEDPVSSRTESESSEVVSDIELEGTTGEFVQADDRLLVVVNNDVDLPKGFKTNLTNAYDAKIDKSMVDAWEDLYDAGVEEGHYYWITYSYRSEKEQNAIYNSNVKSMMADGMSKKEAQKKADVTVQKGGDSEYITGLSVGVNTANDAFGKTSDYKWLVENGPKYGFILRYPADKEEITGIEHQPWRFRYVGKKHAQEMTKRNMCLEEYVMYLHNKDAEKAAADKAEVITDASAATASEE